MPKAKNRKHHRPRASSLCRHFEGTDLVGCARAGLDVLESDHKRVVAGGSKIGCGVALDRCRQTSEPMSPRWDYAFTLRDSDRAIGVEVHHAAAEEVDVMIAKKEWASALLGRLCPDLRVILWAWVAAPDGEVFFSRQHPFVWRLAEAGIEFPKKRLELP